MTGETIQDKQDIVNSVNEHFVNISNLISGSRFNPDSFSHLKQHLDVLLKRSDFNIGYISVFEMKLFIDKLNLNKSAGLDCIGPRVLKLCGDAIVNSITFIIDQSIESTNVFPGELVTPIFKLNNYRPISILPTISNV